jgi:hypothetical protein
MSQRASSKKVIFNATEVSARLAALKAAAADAAEGFAWWAPALSIEWSSIRKGNKGTSWISVFYTDAVGVTGRLIVRINGERHTGQIMPATDAGVAELAARVKNPNSKVEKRSKKPAVQIQKWAAQVKTAEDGVTVISDADGRPVLPGDDLLSPYYAVASLVNEAFTAEAKARVNRGLALLAKAEAMKRADKSVTADAVAEAFAGINGPRRPGDMLLATDTSVALRKLFQGDVEIMTKGATVAPLTKIAHLVQENICSQASKNAGMPLPNPMARIVMNFDATTGVAEMSFFDKDAPFMVEGKQKYEVGKVDGEPVNGDNIHKFIVSRCILDGIVNLDSVCLSSLGISMPVKAEALVVSKPSSREVGFDDIYDDDAVYGGAAAAASGAASGGAAAVAASGGAAAVAASGGAAAGTVEDYTALLADIATG